jgi:hypothetical protein
LKELRDMPCRDELLSAANALCRRAGGDTFTLTEILSEMHARKSIYADATIRTHVTSRMCKNAPTNHAKTYGDFESLGGGTYRLLTRGRG